MSNNTDVFGFLKDMIVDMKDCSEDAVHRDATFEELELDSLDFVEVQVSIKKQFQVTLAQELFADGTIANMGQLSDYIGANVATATT